MAQNEWVVVPTHSSQPQEKPIFVLKYPRYLTSVPGDCRPIVKCRQLGLSKYQPGRGVRPHTGADFGAPSGTPVLAPINLKIVSVNPDSTAGGIISAESLDGRQYFRFVHLDRNSIRELNSRTSKIFNQGETIALVGFEPGGSWGTGPHLHFERYIKSPTSGKWELDWHVEDWLP
ncbi:MAG: M23 family metallopeptidase [Thiotrichales bacterium]|nr:M23 family metallopeptidase [Thiotrichales bacterium]